MDLNIKKERKKKPFQKVSGEIKIKIESSRKVLILERIQIS